MTKLPPKNRYQVFFTSRHNPIRGETKLWRYLTFEKYVSLLETSRLYHARLDQFEDRLEGSVTKLYAQQRDAGNRVGYMPIPDLEPINNRRLMLCRFVVCWHASNFESAAMWKLYSREHAGVAIVTTVQQLKESVTLPKEADFGMLGPVEYLDFANDSMLLPGGLTARPGFTKQKSFEHEKEVRGMIQIQIHPSNPNLVFSPDYVERLKTELPSGISAKVNVQRLVQKVYVSPLAPAWFEVLVRNASTRAGLANVISKSDLIHDPIY
jgi:hypothetical protein